MKVDASSAIATLTISDATLKDDPLFQLVIGAASPLQLTIKKSKKTLGLELSGITLTQRNSILRCLCGMGLHNALDGAPYYLLGGHATSSSATPHRSMSLAAMTSWMSIAHEIKNRSESTIEDLLETLNYHLQTRSYLIDSPSITIADVELAATLSRSSLFAEIKSYPSVLRWYSTVQFTLKHQYSITLAASSIGNNNGPPVFFYGNEADVVVPKTSIATTAKNKGKNSDQNQQQQQQQQKLTKQQRKEAAKAAGGKQESQKKQQPPSAAASTFDVSALDIRVGKIVKVWEHPEADKLFCEEIDVGEDAPRQIASGLRPFYETSQLEGRRVIVLCNLKKRNLVGFPSHGMVLCASNTDHTECMEPPENAEIGQRVTFDGYEGDPEPENKIGKKKIFEKVAPDLRTDVKGLCVWKGAVSNPPVKGLPNSQVS